MVSDIKYRCKKSYNKVIKDDFYTIKLSISGLLILVYDNKKFHIDTFILQRNDFSPYFYDYFYTEKELRKLKLEKLKSYK